MGVLPRLVSVPLLVAVLVASVVGRHHGAAAQAVAPCSIDVGGTSFFYANCLELPGQISMTVGWNILNGTTLRAAHLSDSVGWAGLAFSGTGSAMVAPAPPPVRAVVGFSPAGGPNTASAGVYELTARSSAGVMAMTADAAAAAGYANLAAARNADGRLVVTFDRLLAAAPAVGQGPTNVLWAVGPPPQTGTTLQKHTERVPGSIAFVTAAGAVTPPPEASPTAGPPPPAPSAGPPLPSATAVASPGVSPTADESLDASPEATASPADDDAVCFPAAATVDVVGRGRVAMADLRVGDVVAVGGGRSPSPVYAFSHADAAAVSTFVSLTTAAGAGNAAGGGSAAAGTPPATLRLSPGHYLPVNGRLAAAKTVVVGDILAAGPAGEPVTVTSVEQVVGRGLFNPHTVAGGVLVDGIHTSCYTTAVHPLVASALLAPARWAVALGGASAGRAVERAVEWGRSAVAALPSGRDVL